jgi:hypothetical protein
MAAITATAWSLSCARSLPATTRASLPPNPIGSNMPAYVGPKRWVALRLDSGEIDWDEVAELVSDSYRRIAPKHLASQVKLST